MNIEEYKIELDKLKSEFEKLINSGKYLSHYTSYQTLLKIIEGGKLRFTECNGSNDFDEGKWIYRIIDDVICDLENYELAANIEEYFSLHFTISDIDSDLIRDGIEELNTTTIEEFFKEHDIQYNKPSYKILNYVREQDNNKYFHLCFSLEDDITSMWKYYAKGNDYGCSVLFNMEDMYRNINDCLYNTYCANGFIFKCIYDIEIQTKIIEERIKLIEKYWSIASDDEKKCLLDEFGDFVVFNKYVFKHPDFKDEYEVKYLAIIYPSNYEILTKNGTINKYDDRFYFDCDFTGDKEVKSIKYHIERILLSRTMKDFNLYKNVIEELMDYNKYTNYSINKSESPLKDKKC